MSEAATNWHRDQRRCLGGDLTSALACVVFLNPSETAGLDLEERGAFLFPTAKKKIILLFTTYVQGKSARESAPRLRRQQRTELLSSHYGTALSLEMESWNQQGASSKLVNSVPAHAEPVGDCALHSRLLLEKDFHGVTFECLSNSSIPWTGGLLRKEDQKQRDTGGVYYAWGQQGNRSLWESVCPSDWDAPSIELHCRSQRHPREAQICALLAWSQSGITPSTSGPSWLRSPSGYSVAFLQSLFCECTRVRGERGDYMWEKNEGEPWEHCWTLEMLHALAFYVLLLWFPWLSKSAYESVPHNCIE